MDPHTIYVDSHIWLPKALFQVDSLRAQLTYQYGDSTYRALKEFTLYEDRKTHLGVPRNFFLDGTLEAAATKRGCRIVDQRPATFERVEVDSIFVPDAIHLDEDVQKEAHKTLARSGDGILTLACGRGKSGVSLHLWAKEIKGPLLVMADNTSILEQWEREIRRFILPSDIPIGHIYDRKTGAAEKRKDPGWEAPIVLASIQSVYPMAKSLPDEIRRRFALVVIDELHKVAAPVYCTIAPIFLGRRLGTTATSERTDRLDRVYKAHIGAVLFRYLRQPLTPKFYFYRPVSSQGLMDDPAFRQSIMSWGELHVAKLWTALARQPGRTQELANLIKDLRDEGRRVLVISQRKELLRELNKLLPDAGLIVAEVKLKQRSERLAKSAIVLGIQGIAKEGLDAVQLSALVICEPFKDLNLFQQIVGRILRDVPGKPVPKVVIVEDLLGEGAGPVYGLCRRLKSIIAGWPAELGGPYSWQPYKE